VVAALGRLLQPDTIVTTDAGHFGGWAARGLWLRRPGTYLGPTAGAMGYGLPAAVAASLASPGRPVVALVGDGGLGMSVAELETAVREGARPIVLVFDNERYGTIRDHQDRRGFASVGTELGPVDWSAVAEAFGAAGARVERDEEFEPALRAALASRRPTVLHLAVDRRWVSVDRIEDAPAAAAAVPPPVVEAASPAGPAEPEAAAAEVEAPAAVEAEAEAGAAEAEVAEPAPETEAPAAEPAPETEAPAAEGDDPPAAAPEIESEADVAAVPAAVEAEAEA
jgi:hypothetical protein